MFSPPQGCVAHYIAAAICLLGLGPAFAQADAVRVLDQIIMDESQLSGEKIGEFSALVRDPAGNGVLAISDRGYVATLAVEVLDDSLARVEVLDLHVLTGLDDRALREDDFNPEAAAVLPDGAIAIVDETTARLAIFDTAGRWVRDEGLPAPVSDTARQASPKGGIEALAWTPKTGFIAVTEEPQKGQPRHLHSVYSTLAGAWTMGASEPLPFNIKAMESVGDQLFVLERTRDTQTKALLAHIRILDLTTCQAATPCNGRRLSVDLDDLADADFDGLVHLGDGRFLMVSDDKIRGRLRSVFVLFSVN